MREIVLKFMKNQLKSLINQNEFRRKLWKDDEDVILALKETIAYLESKNDAKA